MHKTSASLAIARASLIMALAASAQEPQPIPIHFEKLTRVAGMPGTATIASHTRCAEDGTIYFEAYQRQAPIQPLFAVGPDAKKWVRFQIPDEESEGVVVKDFSEAGSTVALLANAGDGRPMLIRFDRRGKYQDSIPLETHLHVSRLAMFPSGVFLVLGVQETDDQSQAKTLIELFDQSGRVLTKVDLQRRLAENSKERLPEDIERAQERLEPEDKLAAVTMSLLESSSDVAYLLHYSPTAPFVSAISQAGELVRRFTIEPPGEGFTPTALRAGGTQLLVAFTRPGDDGAFRTDRYVVYDAVSGERILLFEAGENVGGTFGCYDWRGGFTFVSATEQDRVIVRGQAR